MPGEEDDMTAWIHLRVHPAAKAQLEELARASGIRPSKLVRSIVYKHIGVPITGRRW